MHIPWDLIVAVVCAVVASSGFWTWLSGKSVQYKKIQKAIDYLTKAVSDLDDKLELDKINNLRWRILGFDSELRKNEKHTQEEFIEIISAIDEYEAYCQTHAGYRNNKAKFAIENIKNNYQERQKERDYL